MSPISAEGGSAMQEDSAQQDTPAAACWPRKGSWIRVQLPYTDDQPWLARIYAITKAGMATVLVEASNRGSAVGDVLRLVQLVPGSWQPAEQPAHHNWPLPPCPAISRDPDLQLLDKTVRVWLHSDDPDPAVATVLAYTKSTRQHTLLINGATELADLHACRWGLVDGSAQQSDAAVGDGAAAPSHAAAAPPVPRHHKRKLEEEQPHLQGASVGKAVGAAPDSSTDAAAATGTHAPASGCSQRRIQVTQVLPIPEPAAAAAAAAQDSTHAALKASEGSRGKPVSEVDAAALDSRAGEEAKAQGLASTAADASSVRPQRNRQPSKRLMPLEAYQDAAQQAGSGKPHNMAAAAQPAAAAATGPGPAKVQPAPAGWVTDEQLLDAVAAAHVPHLAAGTGQLQWPVSNNMGIKALVVQLDSFVLGNPISSSISNPQIANLKPQLYKQVTIDDQAKWQQLSQPCHDCQEEHVPRTCRQPGCRLHMSVCNRCLLSRYHTLYSLTELLECCPACRGACACDGCLRDADHMQLVPPLQHSQQQQDRQARYVLRELMPHLRGFLQQQQAEAAAWGFAGLQQVPASPLDVLVRPLCDRCATQVAGIVAHCTQCGWDVCCECAADLRRHAASSVAAADTGAAGMAAAQPAVTCCNPDCCKAGAGQENSDVLTCQPSAGPMAGIAANGQADGSQQQQGHEHGHEDAMEVDGDGCVQQESGGDDGGVQVQPAVVRRELFGSPSSQLLQLQLVLPPDLFDSLAELEQLAQQDDGVEDATLLQLHDCPLLSLEDLQLLHSSPLTVPVTAQPLTLQHLQSHNWWQHLPEPYSDLWRRCAAVPGRAGAELSGCKPACDMQEGPATGQHSHAAAAAAHVCDSCTEGKHAAAAATAAAGSTAVEATAGGCAAGATHGAGTCSSSSSFLFAPHIRDLSSDGTVGVLARLVFWARWRLVEPIIVWGIKGAIPWDPATLERAMGGVSSDAEISVLDCEDFSEVAVSHNTFFTGYLRGHMVLRERAGKVQPEPVMYKLKDWPPSADIREQLCRHYADFLAALPMRCYTEPRLGAGLLNVATALQPRDNPTDLGPKCYIAYGRVAESEGEGDSVTKCHCDMTDAVNLMLDTAPGGDPDSQAVARQQQQQPQRQEGVLVGTAGAPRPARCGDQQAQLPGYQGAGAVWDIWSRASLALLEEYLSADAARFMHRGQPVLAADDPVVLHSPVLSQSFMLAPTHREAFMQGVQAQQQQQQQGQQWLSQGQSVQLWHFEQYEGEAVFIPGGCAHQVRNLKSCCKAAADFVSPENLGEALALKARLRQADLNVAQPADEGPDDRCCQEKLQSQLILLRGALRAARVLQQGQG